MCNQQNRKNLLQLEFRDKQFTKLILYPKIVILRKVLYICLAEPVIVIFVYNRPTNPLLIYLFIAMFDGWNVSLQFELTSTHFDESSTSNTYS